MRHIAMGMITNNIYFYLTRGVKGYAYIEVRTIRKEVLLHERSQIHIRPIPQTLSQR